MQASNPDLMPPVPGQTVLGRKFKLRNDTFIPAVGISTYRVLSESAVYNLIDKALGAGYRLFDTGALYGNEIALRHAFAHLLPKYHVERQDLYITSKLITMESADYASVRKAFLVTLRNLGLDYIDLFLINSPLGSELNRRRTWAAMCSLVDEGYVISVGVSNYGVEHLREISTCGTAPMVNQLEWHPLRHSEDLLNFCKHYGIRLQAYCPFGSPFASTKRLFTNPIVQEIAVKHEVPPSQVVLMWSLQQNVAVLPLSTNQQHLRQNNDFPLKLSPGDMTKLSGLIPNPGDSEGEI